MSNQASLFDDLLPKPAELIDVTDRTDNYDKNHCWQYEMRLRNYHEDLFYCGLSKEYADTLDVRDFTFDHVTDETRQQVMISFIERHEWLGNISQYTTNWFACYHKNILAGVILMNVPNAFSKLLGDNTDTLERLISRGACISWSPKNLASCFMMWCIKYMVKNTPYRLFTAYSDPSAKELGTIYQACNFYYLGQNSGASVRYISPHTGKVVSDRYFRQKTAYKRFAKELGIQWQESWNDDNGMLWDNVPTDIAQQLRTKSKDVQAVSEKVIAPKKHKYAYVLGANNRETKQLKRVFEERNKIYPYPKQR